MVLVDVKKGQRFNAIAKAPSCSPRALEKAL
jgi:hypothetical protein